MITSKIRKSDDDSKLKKNKGSVADERAAMAALCKKTGKSAYFHKTRPKRPGRGTSGGGSKGGASASGGSVPLGRAAHKKSFNDLVKYCIEGKVEGAHPDGEGRTGLALALNSPVAQDGQQLNASEAREVGEWMGDTAAQNTRIRASAALHYVVALPPEETAKVSPDFWNDVAARTLDALDMKEHELLLIEHIDTDHRHAHIIVNRVHPTTNLGKTTWKDLEHLEKMTRQIEKDYGLKIVPGRLIDPETGERYTLEKIKKNDRPNKRPPRAGVNDFRKRALEKLAKSKPFSTAKSWAELDEKLAKHGYHLQQKGGGLEIVETVLSDKNERGQKQVTSLKISAIAGKNNGLKNLEARFGESFADFDELHVEAAKTGVSIEKQRLINQKTKINDEKLKTENKLKFARQSVAKWGGFVAITPDGGETKVAGGPQMTDLELSKISEILPKNELIKLFEKVNSIEKKVKSDFEKFNSLSKNERPEGLADHHFKGVLSGSEEAKRRISGKFKYRFGAEINEYSGPEPDVLAVSLAVSPLQVKDVSEFKFVEQKISKMSQNELKNILLATREQVSKTKLKKKTSVEILYHRSFLNGANILVKEFKNRGLDVPKNQFIKPKYRAKNKDQGR